MNAQERELDEVVESAIRGLMILGRTREKAVAEYRENQAKRDRDMERDFWNYHADFLR